jgi:hypothetical protein
MQCEAMREAWLAAQYAKTEPSPDVREHIAGCADCATYARAQPELDALLAQSPAVEVGLGFDTRFFAKLEAERARSRQRRRWLWLAPLPLCAALVLALIVQLREPPPIEHASAEDTMLARDLELVQALPVLRNLDEIEAYETLAQVDDAELVAELNETQP